MVNKHHKFRVFFLNFYLVCLTLLSFLNRSFGEMSDEDKFRLKMYAYTTAIIDQIQRGQTNREVELPDEMFKNWVIGCTSEYFIQKGKEFGCKMSLEPQQFYKCYYEGRVYPAPNPNQEFENLSQEYVQVVLQCLRSRRGG